MFSISFHPAADDRPSFVRTYHDGQEPACGDLWTIKDGPDISTFVITDRTMRSDSTIALEAYPPEADEAKAWA